MFLTTAPKTLSGCVSGVMPRNTRLSTERRQRVDGKPDASAGQHKLHYAT